MNIKIALTLIAIYIVGVLGGYQAGYQAATDGYETELVNIRERIREAEADIENQRQIYKHLQEIQEKNNRIIDKLEELLKTWEVYEAEITYYAPLDPNAVEGMCYSGDPTVTASGAPVEIGVTAAANDLPFGTLVFIEGHGPRIIQDRGALDPGQIDVAVWAREEALQRGRHPAKAIYAGKKGTI